MSNEAWHNARAMYENDNCAKALGIEIIAMDQGYAQMTMAIAPNMLNGHHTCHGGQLFSLADTAFAYACNSQGLAAVASAASIDPHADWPLRRGAGQRARRRPRRHPAARTAEP